MNIAIRQAVANDVQDIAHVHVEAWRATYAGIVPQPFLDSLDVASRAEAWTAWLDKTDLHTYVAEMDEKVCGFISGGALREPIEDFDAEVYAIYLLPSAMGRGIGKLLMQRLAETLLGDGFSQVAVWVLADNPSRGFYEHLGGWQIAQKSIQIGEADLMEVAYGWRDIRVLVNFAEGCA